MGEARGRHPGAKSGDRGPCECPEAIDQLFEFLDAELPGPQQRRLAAHVAACPDCSDAASAERHVRDLIRRSCVERAPDGLRIRVVTQLSYWRISG